MTEREIFLEAIELDTPEARAAYLKAMCGADAVLRHRIEELLKEHFSNDRLLAGPAIESDRGSAPASEPPTRAGVSLRIDRYKLLEKIGEGGFGEVWMAEQHEPVKRRVALKIIKPGMDSRQIVARFEGERQALAIMDHPNIARIFDAGTTESGRPYFVMELVCGVKITEYCEQNQLPTLERLKLFIVVCQAIQHAHQKGIIHRDIKPSNILVTLHDGVPAPKVIDFGIAKATQQNLTDETVFTQFLQFMGTPAYISPEQAQMSGLDVDTRTDIYSLGVLLYELLTGKTPFDNRELLASGLDAMRRIIWEKAPVRPSTVLARQRITEASSAPRPTSIDRDLDWIVMKCLEKDRTRRYATANGLSADLQRHLTNEPIVARPPSAIYRLRKASQRHKVAFTATIAVVLALVFGSALSAWQAVVATQSKRDALLASSKAEVARKEAEASRQAEASIRLEAERQLYAANMNLAQQAWERNNFGRIRRLLDATTTHPERGFEWYYWQRQAHLDLRTFRGHRQRVWSATFSNDGLRVLTASDDLTAKIWDATSGQELLTLAGHTDWVRDAAFSPDGGRVVTAGKDFSARLWDAATGQELLTLNGHRDSIRSVEFSPEGDRIVTASQDGTAKVWDAATGKNILTIRGQAHWVFSASFAPDGKRIATGGDDQTIRIWDATTAQELLTLKGHRATVRSVSFSPDGRRLVSASEDETAKVWAVADGQQVLSLVGHSGVVFSAHFSPDSRRIVTAGWDRVAKIWDAATGQELKTLRGHESEVCSAVFSPDGHLVLTADRDATAKLWSISDNAGPLVLAGHRRQTLAVACSPDNQWLATGGDDGLVKVWSAPAGELAGTLEGHTGAVQALAFSSDGQQLASCSQDESVRLWRPQTGQALISWRSLSGVITSIAFTPDGLNLVTAGSAGQVIVWQAGTGHKLLALARSPVPVYSARFSPDGRRLAIASEQGAKVYDAVTGLELFALAPESVAVHSVDFSPNGQWIVTAGEDMKATVWDTSSGAYHATLSGHSAVILSVLFSPDGKRILTGSADRSVRLWDLAGSELLTLTEHNSDPAPIAFSPDGTGVATGDLAQTARVWRSATLREVADWTAQETNAVAARTGQPVPEGVRARDHEPVMLSGTGAIRQWLVLAPLSFIGSASIAELEKEQIPQEAELRPRAGQSVQWKGTERFWERIDSRNSWINFNNVVGKVTPQSAAYAVCYILSQSDQSGLVMRVVCDDHAKVYLNGRLVYRSNPDRANLLEETPVAGIHIRAGVNPLVFKVLNETGGWRGSIRLTNASNQPVVGLRVVLEPDPKE
jgi:WD40 repeat protein/serine/threonine protein kinase